MKSFFQRFHDSQPATSKSSRTKDAANKQRISSSKPEKQHPPPSNGTGQPTERHTPPATSPRPSNDSTADSHGHVATSYSTRYSTFPGSSTNRHLLPNPSRSHTYPIGSPANEQKVFPQNDTSKPPTRRNEPPESSSHDGHIAFRVKSERPSQSHPLSPLPPTQHQVWLPEVQVEPKEKRRQRHRRHGNEDEGAASRPQQKPNSTDSEHVGAHQHYADEQTTEAYNHRRSDQKEKEPNSKEHHRDQASAVMKESLLWEQQLKDAHQLRERENRKKERVKLRKEREDAEDKEKAKAKEKLEQDRMRVKLGPSERGEAKEKSRGDEWDRGWEEDRIAREERHRRRELQKEKEARERQIQLEQKELNEKRDREREAKDERERERRAKEEREQERRERKARERQAERERLAAYEQTEKLERERQERQRQKERDQQERRVCEQAELERRDPEFSQRDRITQKQVQPRKDQDIRQQETKLNEIDMLRADRDRQERRKKERQLWEQQRQREREERERRWRGDQVGQVSEHYLSETGVDKVSIRSKRRVKEGVSDSERDQGHVHPSDRLASRVSTQVNELTETENDRSAPNANSPRRLDSVDEPGEPQTLSKSALRGDEYTHKKLQNQSRPPGRSVSVPETSPVATVPKQVNQPPLSSSPNTPGYNPLGFLTSHKDIPPIERPGSTAPPKSSPHPVSYSVVRVPGPESSKQIPEVMPPQVARRRTASSSQDRSAIQLSRPTLSTQSQAPYPGPISSRPTLLTSAALEDAPQEIKILPPETSVPQTGILSVPQSSPNHFQESSLAGRGTTVAPSVTTPAATHTNAHGNQETPTQDDVIARSFQAGQSGPSVDYVAPVPPTPSQPSAGFLAVPGFHHPVKYSHMKDDDVIPQNKESPEYGNPRQKDSVPQATVLQPIPPVPVSKPAVLKRQSNPVQYEPPRDAAPAADNSRTAHISRESPGTTHNRLPDESRSKNTFPQSLTVLPTDEIPLQVSTTPVEPQYSGGKPADRNSKHQRLITEPVPPTIARYQEFAYDKGHRAENHLPTGGGHSRHQRHASENDVINRGGKPLKHPSEGFSASHSQQIQEAKQRTNTSSVNPNNNKEGDEKVAFRLPVSVPAISAGSPDGKPQNLVSEPQPRPGPTLQDRQQQAHHVNMPSSVPSAGFTTTAALVGNAIVRPGTAVPRPSATQPPDDHTRALVSPIAYSQSQSGHRPPIDRPGTAIGIRQSTSTTSQSLARGTQPVTLKPSSNNKAELLPFPDKPVSSVRPTPTENIPQKTLNEYTRSRANSETVLVPNLSHPNETHNRLRADVPAQHAPYQAKEASSKIVSPTSTTELSNKPMLSATGPAVEIIQQIGAVHPERTAQIYDDRPTTRSITVGKVGGHGTTQQQSGLPQSYNEHEPVARQDDSGGQFAIHSAQPRQRKQTSPRLQSESNLLKVPGQKGSSIEDQRLATYKTGQTYSTRRVEPLREDQSSLPTPGYLTEADVQLSIQHSPADDRGRSKHSAAGYSPNALQRTSPMLGDPAPTLPHYPGNSQIQEGRHSRSQRNAVHVKDVKVVELPLPPKASDVPGQLYLHDARRNLASKLELQQLDGSPNSVSGNSLGNVEGDKRMRMPPNRDEQSLRHVGGDSSPSISSKASQSPDVRTKDYIYARTSPNTSQPNPSPRLRGVVVESQPQPGIQSWDENPQHATRTPASRQPLRERPDRILEAEDKYSRSHHQTSTYAPNDTVMRPSDTHQKPYIAPDRVPYQIQDPRAGKTTSQQDVHRGETRDAAQPMAPTHSRSQSYSQIALDNTVSHSRHANSAPPPATLQSQPYLVTSSDHVRPSAPTVEPFVRHPDQSSHPYSHQLDQSRVPREKAIPPQQTIQPPTMKSTPPKRDTIEQLPQETHYQNISSGPQHPTSQSYDIWLPPTSREDRSHRSTVSRASHRDPGRERDRPRRSTATPRAHQSSTSVPHPPAMDPRFAKAYHYIKTRKVHTMSLVSLEAQDGAASTVIGSPTTSILSQIPINIPPEQDPILAAREWTEAGAIAPGQRIRKPGLVWADPEDPPLNYQQAHRPRSSLRRRTRSSGSRSREASDSDQPLPA